MIAVILEAGIALLPALLALACIVGLCVQGGDNNDS